MDEQQLTWRKSSWSDDQGGDCVEVALTANAAYVRDSKDPQGGTIRMSAAAWPTFVQDVTRDIGSPS